MTTPRPGNADTPDAMSAVSQLVPIAEIGELKAEDYVGLIDREAIESLKVRLAAEGLHTPIWLRGNGNAWKGARYSVIAGRHRLIAARELGWTEIAAEVRAGPDSKPDRIKVLQLIENLDRRIPRPIERACLIMERWRAVAATVEPSVPNSQQAAAIRQRWGVSDSVSDTELVDAAMAATGLGCAKTVQRYRRIYELIVVELPDLFVQLNAHPLGKAYSTMTKLCVVREIASRRRVAELLLSKPDWQSITEVLNAAGISASPGFRSGDQAKHEKALRSAWEALPSSAKRSHFVEMAQDIPHALVLETIEKLKARLK